MPKVIAVFFSFLILVGWMSIVGNPHFVETIIGLVIALFIGFWTYRKLQHFTDRFKG